MGDYSAAVANQSRDFAAIRTWQDNSRISIYAEALASGLGFF